MDNIPKGNRTIPFVVQYSLSDESYLTTAELAVGLSSSFCSFLRPFEVFFAYDQCNVWLHELKESLDNSPFEKLRVPALILGRCHDLQTRRCKQFLDLLFPVMQKSQTRLVRQIRLRTTCPSLNEHTSRQQDERRQTYVHLLRNLDSLAFLFVLRIDCFLFLLDELGLAGTNWSMSRVSDRLFTPRREICTFSMANSSSALTLISRAFSRASCLMKATWTPSALSNV